MYIPSFKASGMSAYQGSENKVHVLFRTSFRLYFWGRLNIIIKICSDAVHRPV